MPWYDPWAVYGVWPYPGWGALWSPWYPPGFVAVGVIGFGVPIFVGPAIWATYRWGSWGGGVHVNVNYYNKWNNTKLASTGNTSWKQNSQFATGPKPGLGGLKPGLGGQQIQTTKFSTGTGTSTKVNTGLQNKITTPNNAGTNLGNKVATSTNAGSNLGNKTTRQKTGTAQGIASINQNSGPKPLKTNTGNTVRTNLGNTQRLNAAQNFRANTGFKPNVGAARVSPTVFKKK